MTATVTVLFDNHVSEKAQGFESAWGFSCAVCGFEEKILFDTGSDSGILLANMQAAGIPVSDFGAVVISHSHYDHAGGLVGVTRLAKNGVRIYLPPTSFPPETTEVLRRFGAQIIHPEIGAEVCSGIYVLHTRSGGSSEQSLFLRSGEISALLTGCAHPGIAEIVQNVSSTFKQVPQWVIGGLHLRGDEHQKFDLLAKKLKDAGVRFIAPAHCTSRAAIEAFHRIFGDNCVEAYVGKQIKVQQICLRRLS
jgi:7,8-dihydropterin-6-yl-methyl-4-(beta-D-ribofuranosyl)aminobenzene 5'-phosphate synthase